VNDCWTAAAAACWRSEQST
jgi:hypothetical protein